ncbi:MAG: cobyric acid synthase [Rhodospirillaceae bacterium]|nr:cobyric acid synthase [Rhodospirillaceae bacterium]
MSGDISNTTKPARALMVQGTGSDVGKSLLVAGLCRAFHRRGLRVRPFKPQNMSNNAAVASDGTEIGRAQALQAQAAGVRPSVHMNPVLLKPEGETGSQLVVQGRVEGRVKAKDFRTFKKTLLPRVLESFEHLKAEADLVLIEGAGSPAEINLREGDIANFGFAEAADVPVILVGDVEKGGVIAQLVGTHSVLQPGERDRVQGFVVNKFRGDVSLFDDAVSEIRTRTGWAALGTVPWFEGAGVLPKEDSASLSRWIERGAESSGSGHAGVHIAVFQLPRIANFDDLDPLMNENDVVLTMVAPGSVLPRDADVAVIPGSKAVISDLRFLKAQGWDVDIKAFHRLGGKVVGLCGGYQMLGERVVDPDGVEGHGHDEEAGLELLAVESILTGDKTLEHVDAVELSSDLQVEGYEMHLGLTEGPDRARPWFRLSDGRHEGAVSKDAQVMGTYLHGLFQSDDFRDAFLTSIAGRRSPGASHAAKIESALDQLADHLEAHMDLDQLLELAR